LSSLLNNGAEEAPPKQAKSENSLGQMMASTNTGSDPATSSDSEVGALRDLFAPQSSGDVAPAAAPTNGKNTSHEQNPDALVAVAAENSQQAVPVPESAPVSKGLGGLIRTPANAPAAAESPVARGTDNGADVTDAAGGASSLSSVLAKASTSTPGISKFVGGTRGTPVSTGALSPLSVPSIDRGNSLLKPEEPYDPAELHKIGAIGSVGTTGRAKSATDTGEIAGAVAAINAGVPKPEVEAAFNAQSFASQPTVEEPEVPPNPAAKSTSAFAHLVASAPKKSAEAIAETIDVESSNERVESVVDRYPAEVPGATAPAMPNPTPADSSTTEATPAPPPTPHVPQSLSSTLKDMVPADPNMQLNPSRDVMAVPPAPAVAPALREMEPVSIPSAAIPASPAAPAVSKLARAPSDQTLEPVDSPVVSAPAPAPALAPTPAPTPAPASAPTPALAPTPAPTPAPASAPTPALAPAPAPTPASAPTPAPAPMPTPAAPVASVTAPTAMQPAPVPAPAAAAQPAPPQSAPAPAHGGNSDNVTASSESPETKTEVKEALGSALNRLAESYYQQGNHPEAQGLYEKILSLRQQQIGPKNPALGADLTNLAGVLCVQGKFAQAEPFVRRVVTLIEATEPVDVLKLAGSINTLAGILFQQGKLEECEPLLGRALQLRKDFLGEDVIEVADSLRDYAKLLKKLGRIEEAERHYLQAKAIVARRQQAAMTPPA
jgi:Flp pilus assembly protein TadD